MSDPLSASPHGAINPSSAASAHVRDGLLAFTAMLILTDAFDVPLSAAFGASAVASDVPLKRLLLLAVFAATLVLLVRHARRAADNIWAARFLWPAVILAFASAAWSDAPWTTLVWSAALLGTSLFGVAFAAAFSPRAQCELVAAVCSGIALMSALFALLWPAAAFSGAGELQALYQHQNLLGRVMALGVVAAAAALATGQRRRFALGALVLSGGIMLAAQSRSAILVAAIAVGVALLLQATRKWRRHAGVILIAGVGAMVLAATILVATRSGLTLIGRETTFSGRTAIWETVMAGAMQTPWLGHGYGAFWQGPAGEHAGETAERLIRMRINHAHNGALDLFAELGVVGVLLVLVPLAVITVAAFRYALAPNRPASLWPATYIVYLVASNVAESGLLRHKIYWALYVAVACTVSGRNQTPTRAPAAAEPKAIG